MEEDIKINMNADATYPLPPSTTTTTPVFPQLPRISEHACTQTDSSLLKSSLHFQSLQFASFFKRSCDFYICQTKTRRNPVKRTDADSGAHVCPRDAFMANSQSLFGAFGALSLVLASPPGCGDLEEVVFLVCRGLLLPLENTRSNKGTLSSPVVIVGIHLNSVNQQTDSSLCRPEFK